MRDNNDKNIRQRGERLAFRAAAGFECILRPVHSNGGVSWGYSGGPAFWIAPDGTRTLVAVTSWSASSLGTSFYWRVDLPETQDFINSVIQGLEP